MRKLVVRRYASEPPFNRLAADELVEDNWWSDHERLSKAFRSFQRYRESVAGILSCVRTEGYLIDEDGTVIGCAVYVRQLDIHHGLIASPITVIVKSEHRGNLNVTRKMLKLIRSVARTTGATRYYQVTHLNDNVQIHKLRNV